LQVFLPVVLIIQAEPIEGIPGVDAGVVFIVEVQTDGIITHRIDMGYIHSFFAHLQDLLPWTMALYLRGGGEYPEILRGITEFTAIVEADLQYAGLLVQMDLGRIGV
jgi:hypothetical protein